MTSILKRKELKEILIFLLISIFYLLIFSSTTSPLSKYYYGSDSGFFILVGKMMKNGYVPYVDIFDHKGPYFFLLQEIGQIVKDGRTGIFCLQTVSLTISLYLIAEIIKLGNNNISLKWTIFLIAVVLFIEVCPLSRGNLTEEFSLPFSLDTLRRTLLFFKSDNSKHNPLIAALYGAYFSLFAFTRITNALFLCGCILSIVIYLILKKNYLNIATNGVLFIIGFVLTTFPIAIYYYKNNALYEMLSTVFIYAFKYATNDVPFIERLRKFADIKMLIYYLPVLLPLCFFNRISKQNKILFVSTLFFSTLSVLLGGQFLHYYVMLVPNYLLSIYTLISCELFDYSKKTALLICLVVVVSFGAFTLKEFATCVLRIADYSYSEKIPNYYQSLYNEENELVSVIPKNERNSIWGYRIKSKFYIKTNTYPGIRHFDFVDQLNSHENLRNEIIELLNSGKVKWIVLTKEDFDNAPDYLISLLENKDRFKETKNYILYKLY